MASFRFEYLDHTEDRPADDVPPRRPERTLLVSRRAIQQAITLYLFGIQFSLHQLCKL
jgi:hypothetical protein